MWMMNAARSRHSEGSSCGCECCLTHHQADEEAGHGVVVHGRAPRQPQQGCSIHNGCQHERARRNGQEDWVARRVHEGGE